MHHVAKFSVREGLVAVEIQARKPLDGDFLDGEDELDARVGERLHASAHVYLLAQKLLGETLYGACIVLTEGSVRVQVEPCSSQAFEQLLVLGWRELLAFEPVRSEERLFLHVDDEDTVFAIEADIFEQTCRPQTLKRLRKLFRGRGRGVTTNGVVRHAQVAFDADVLDRL